MAVFHKQRLKYDDYVTKLTSDERCKNDSWFESIHGQIMEILSKSFSSVFNVFKVTS